MTTPFSRIATIAFAALAFSAGAIAQAQPTTRPADDSLYQQFGAQPGLVKLMDDFMVRLLADPRTQPFFKDVNQAHVKEELVVQLCEVAGGPCKRKGPDMWPEPAPATAGSPLVRPPGPKRWPGLSIVVPPPEVSSPVLFSVVPPTLTGAPPRVAVDGWSSCTVRPLSLPPPPSLAGFSAFSDDFSPLPELSLPESLLLLSLLELLGAVL